MFRHKCPDKDKMKKLLETIELLSNELDYEHKRRLLAEMRLTLAVEYEEYFKGTNGNGL